MQQLSEKRKITRFGDEPKTNSKFRIQEGRQAFEILSSTLYSDKVLAVLREYSANAVDSHNMSGQKDRPIQVHIPNSLEPFVSIRDFGPGLSPSEVESLFTTYFSSNKTQTNDASGCFGLGSKSAFAYTDQFTVTSIYEGTKYVYNCFVNSDYEPNCELISKCDSKEESGLEILFAASPKDFRDFRDKAESLYKYYNVAPVIVGAKLNIDKGTPYNSLTIKSGIVYESYTNQRSKYSFAYRNSQRNTCVIVQGSCNYKIDTDQLSNAAKNIYVSGSVVYFPIGSLNISASRESLKYDNLTKENLESAAKEIAEVFTKEIQLKINKASNQWEAATIISSLNSNSNLSQIALDTCSYNSIQMSKLFNGYDRKKSYYNYNTDYSSKARIRTTSQSSLSYYKSFRLMEFANYSPLSHKFVFVVNTDNSKSFIPQLKHNYEHKNEYDLVVLIEPEKGMETEVCNQVLTDFKGSDIVKLCDLDDPPGYVAAKREKVVLYEIDSYFKSSQHDSSKGGVYVNFCRKSPDILDNETLLCSYIKEIRDLELIPEDMTIYGVPATYKKMTNADNWVHAKDYINNVINNKLKNQNREDLNEQLSSYNYITKNTFNLNVISKYKSFDPYFKDVHKLHQLIAKRKITKEMQYIAVFNRLNNINNSVKSNIENKTENILLKYPILFEFGNQYTTEDIFVDYIKLVNKKESK